MCACYRFFVWFLTICSVAAQMSFDNRSSALDEAGSPSPAAEPDMQPASLLCKADCGFYANAAFDGMCSKCFRERATGRAEQQHSGGAAAGGEQGGAASSQAMTGGGVSTHSLGERSAARGLGGGASGRWRTLE